MTRASSPTRRWIMFSQFDPASPDAATRLPDQQVDERAEEELVRDAVDVLPAEIPGVELDLDPVLGGR